MWLPFQLSFVWHSSKYCFTCYSLVVTIIFSNFTDMHTEVNKSEIFFPKLLTQEMGGKDGRRELGEEKMNQRLSRELVLGHWEFQVTARPSSSHHCLLGWHNHQAHRPHGAPTGTAPRPPHPGRGRKGVGHTADLAENTMFCPGYQQSSWHQAHCLATHSP